MRTATFQFSESGGSLNGPDLFRIAFPVEILAKPPFTELPPPFSLKTPFFTEKRFVASPSQKSAQTKGAFVKGDFLGCTSQLSGFIDFSGGCDGFCNGFFGPEGRILRRILWRIFCLVFSQQDLNVGA